MKRSSGAVSIRLCGKLVWILVGFQAVVASAAEIDVFRLMDFHGFLQTRTRYDAYRTQSTDVETITREPKTQREIGLSTHSYIYHPNMLKLDISGSLLMDSVSYTQEQTLSFRQTEIETDSTNYTWNFASAFHFLEKKPYPLTLFYSRQNPLTGGGLAETYSQQNTNYGFNLGLRRPFSPVEIYIQAMRSTTHGESALQLVDDTMDIVTVRSTHTFFDDVFTSFDYNLTRQDSVSGSPNLPIQGTSYLAQRFSLNSRWRFGNQKQFHLAQNAGLDLRDNPERLNTNYSPTLNWTHSPRLQSFYRYGFSSTALPGDADSLSHSGNVGLSYTASERLHGNVEVRASHSEEISQVLLNRYGFSTSASYTRPVLNGTLSLGAGANYDFHDQQATINQIDITDESHTLTGTTRVTLAREFVIDTSPVVTNSSRTQTFVENVDYRLIEIGSQTLLERLISGNILDGQSVLVSYAIDSGSTLSYSTIGTRFNADLGFARYYNVYLRYNENIQSLESGRPTTRLNSTRSVELGARADAPLPGGACVSVGTPGFTTGTRISPRLTRPSLMSL